MAEAAAEEKKRFAAARRGEFMRTMKWQKTLRTALLFVVLLTSVPGGQTNASAGLAVSPVKGKHVAAGLFHSFAIKSDRTAVAWGNNGMSYSRVPEGLNDVVAIDGGAVHSLALKPDGTVVAWGENSHGQAGVPPGLNKATAIAAGVSHSMAVKPDRTVIAWGDNEKGQANVPAGLNDVIAVAGGLYHSLALKGDGTVVAWGNNDSGQTDVPTGLNQVTAIATKFYHSLALKADGTVIAWGMNDSRQTDVPTGVNGVLAIAAGRTHSLALKSDGTVVAWGGNVFGQSDVPPGLNGVVAIAAGQYHSLALKSDGTVVGWGWNSEGQTKAPGSADLRGLTLQEGPINPPFQPSVTEYTYAYVGPSVSKVHLTATLADSTNGALYINDELQSNGGETAVPVTGASTDIPVRVEPFLLPGKIYTIRILKDATAPVVTFSLNGNNSSAKSAAAMVTVEDTESGVAPASLQYAWTPSLAVPADSWAPFTTGDTLKQAGGDGKWYLHVRVADRAGNTTDRIAGPFLLDNTAPEIVMNGSNPMYVPVGKPYMEPGATARDAIDGDLPAATIVTSGDVDTASPGAYEVRYRVTDHAGNASTVTRSVYVKNGPAIYLKGPGTMTVEAKGTFTDPGATAIDVLDNDITPSITVTGTVDTSRLGVYRLDYNAMDRFQHAAPTVTRTVYVKDTQPPVLTLLGNNPLIVGVGGSFNDPGAKAQDGYDGDVSSSITAKGSVDTSRPGSYTLEYHATDRSLNDAVPVTRAVVVIAPPVITLLGPSAMSTKAGESFTDPGAQAKDTYYGDLSGQITVTGAVNTQTPGVYTLRYNVQNPTGLAAAEVTRTVTVVGASESGYSGDSGSSGDSGGSASPVPPEPKDKTTITVSVRINGKETDAKAAKETSSEGQSVLRVALPGEPLTAAFATRPEVVIEIMNGEPVIKTELPAAPLLETLAKQPGAFVQIKAAGASYRLPLSLLANEPKDAIITIAIAKASNATSAAVNATVQRQGVQPLLDNPVRFSVLSNGKEITDFNGSYTARTLSLHSTADSGKATAVWVDAFNQVHFIPSIFTSHGGENMATIFSPRNGMVTVIQSNQSFADLRGYWAQADIELLANKRIAEGVTVDAFVPDVPITRAEFASLLVRSLGLAEEKKSVPFMDVETTDWYAGTVGTAQKAGWINGYEDGTFRPNETITRVEMAAMIARAMKFAGKAPQTNLVVLDRFDDATGIADWAKQAAAQLYAAGIIQGTTETTFGPQERATRAQSAVMLKRMLQYLHFINE
ncbi:immunoglobulin-like domain-containing protein [Paenibacillus elgii]|uniref:immunoglobulin-like domain-containing protein n=1 Tax=Paenibacillus elgii TaxID=189691 RepID=UPI0030D6D559